MNLAEPEVSLAVAAAPAPFSVGEVVGRTFSLCARHAVPLLLVAVLVDAPLVPFALAGEPGRGYYTLSSLVGVALSGSVAAGMLRAVRGERPRVGQMLTEALARFGALFLQSLGGGLLILAGLVLLVAPGALAWTGLAVSVPALLAEKLDAWESLRRSWELTRGRRLAVFLAMLVFLLVMAGGLVLVLVTTELALGEGSRVAAVLDELLTLPGMVLFYAAPAVVYDALRAEREGLDARRVGAVFD